MEMPQISAELDAMITKEAREGFLYWKANATQAQIAKGLEELEKFKTDEAFKNAEIARCMASFAAADADGDGVLNAAEWEAFMVA